MAITRAQQAKQMLQDGGRLGFKKGRDTDFQQRGMSKSDYAASTKGAGGDGGGRNPMKQFEAVRTPNIVDEVALTSSANRNFMRDARDAVTPLGDRLLNKVPFSGGLLGSVIRGGLNVFSPSPFGFSRPQAVDLSMNQRNGRSGILPLWAQLGFNSEEEFQAAQRMAQASSTMDQEPEDPEGLRLRFAAEGGPIGGIMDIESGRQMYFLGKLVKKATRAVKKIVKSPIGKAALIGGLTFGIPKTSFGGLLGTAKGTAFKNFLASKATDLGLLEAGGGLTGKGLLALGGLGLTAAPLIFGTGEEDDEDQTLDRGERLDIARIRANPNLFLARRFVAEGGSMKEPVAKKTMPLLDMGGKEMDLREEGGFVPIGRMEKADDVPARLSKNEFVFTADAVRNAGDGDVDKGAEVMYNMMKNLESGGDVSEESQGLEGARKMFQTSQRLEEVL